MSVFEIKMPKLGESITEGTIVSWSVKVGDKVKEDDVLFEVTTAKVSAEVPSPVAGKVLEILHQEGDTVPVGTTVAKIELSEDDEEEEDTASSKEESQPEQPQQGQSPQEPATQEQPQQKQEEPSRSPSAEEKPQQEEKQEQSRWYSPVVLQLAREGNVSQEELDKIQGTGYEGRVSKKDIQQYIVGKRNNAERSKNKQAATQSAAPTSPAAASSSPQPAKPAAPAAAPAPAQEKKEPAAPPVQAAEGDEVKEMDRVRRIIAEHMVMSKKVSPHVTTFVEADVTPLVRWRSQVKDEFRRSEGIALTYMPAITEAVAKALKEFPQVNASVSGTQIILKRHINIGIAVSLPDGNLIVPVIKDADKLNLQGLASRIDTLANKARAGKLSPDDMSGGTFTITNFGTFRNLFATPIINQPEVAILGVGYIEKKPAVVETPEGDAIAIRSKMFLSLSYDHRIIDGALGGAFLRRVADYLEQER